MKKICSTCNVLDDEPHSLSAVQKYNSKRSDMFAKIIHCIATNFKLKNEVNKYIYIYLMKNENPMIIKPFARFIYECLFKR